MSAFEPNPPTRKAGGFPKTTTIPEGWDTGHMTGGQPHVMKDPVTGQPIDDPVEAMPVPATGRSNGRSNEPHTADGETESPFARQLNPFPSEADLNGTWL